MSKKLLGLKVAENLVRQNNMSKIDMFIRGGKFDSEAARYIADETGLFSHKYSFDELYSSFEEYVNSKLATRLFKNNDSGEIIHWITLFPENSNELMEIYNKSNDLVKRIIYKTCIFRKRTVTINPLIADKYCNCYEALAILIQENADGLSTTEVLNYLFYWTHIIGRDWFERLEKEVGKSYAITAAKNRLDSRYGSYPHNKMGSLDALRTYTYLMKNNERINLYSLKEVLCPTSWGPRDKKEDDFILENLSEIYRLTISPMLKAGNEDLESLRVLGDIAATCMVYEKDEDRLNRLFTLGIKANGLSRLVENIGYYTRNSKFVPTQFMEDTTVLHARDWNHLLLKNPITSAKQLLKCHREWFIGKDLIGGFSCNGTVLRAINLKNFSQEEFGELENVLNWRRMDEYFENEIIPYEIIMSFGLRIGNAMLRTCKSGILTPEQIVSILDKYDTILEDYDKHSIINRTIYGSHNLSSEMIANLIKRSPRQDFDISGFNVEDSSATVKSILTLL